MHSTLFDILVIGMTNRLDMIDEALLRPGRLEVHMEINLPDEPGRLQIYKIHTAKVRPPWIAPFTPHPSDARKRHPGQ